MHLSITALLLFAQSVAHCLQAVTLTAITYAPAATKVFVLMEKHPETCYSPGYCTTCFEILAI